MLGVITSDYVVFKDISPVISTLQNISAALFTLTGIWVAYLYPEAISVVTNSDNVVLMKGGEHTQRIESLVFNILISAFVLVCTLLFNMAVFVGSNIPFVLEYRSYFKMAALSFIYFLCFSQCRAVFSLMIANIKFVDKLHALKVQSDVNKDL